MTALLLACDLDGTLTFDGRRPHPDVVAALRRAASTDGVRLVLATARSTRCLRRWFGPLVLDIDLVCCNGALHVSPDGHRTRRPLSSDAVAHLLPRLDRAGVGWCLEYGDRFLASARDVMPWMGSRHRVVRRPGRPVPTDEVLKLSVERSEPVTGLLADLPDVVLVPHATGDGDVMPRGVTKGLVVASLREGSLVTGFGNDRNDLELLLASDRGFVVGPGLPELDAGAHIRRLPPDPLVVAHALADVVAKRSRRRGSLVADR